MEGIEEEVMLGVGKFRFENEQINNWVNTKIEQKIIKKEKN